MVVLITGCRSGIGLFTAVEAARRGHRVYGGLRDLDTAQDLIDASKGLDVIPLQLDVTKAAERKLAIEQILAQEGRLDALVNNAGVALGGFMEQIEEDEFRRLFEVNLFGVWALTKEALPAMRRQGDAVILNVSSLSGRMALPGLGSYASAKFALEGMTEAWRHELKPFGIRVITVQPVAFRTDIFGRNRNLCRNAHLSGNAYEALTQRLDRTFDRIVKWQAGDPANAAHTIVDLLEKRRPRFRYALGADARIRAVILKFAPFGLVEAVLGRALRE
ncbi:MAG: SDR family oxidoreductase [Proteobacteria bacterium]|nr:SDR family oxidoreductase [Pseudomonadota bacterium]